MNRLNVKKKKKKKIRIPGKPGRPRVNHEFLEARELVRNEGISSVGQYAKWWTFNLPAMIPKRPDRAYKKEWISWSDFLGSNNIFPFINKSCRPFEEARTFAQQLALNTKTEWIKYAKSSSKPVDIPSRPDLYYRKDWFTWKDWLGADIASIKRNLEASPAVFFIIQNYGRPNNVYQFGITMEGKETVIRAQSQQKFRIIQLFHCDIGFNWTVFAEKLGRNYWESGRKDEYIITNINDFIFNIHDFVEKIRL